MTKLSKRLEHLLIPAQHFIHYRLHVNLPVVGECLQPFNRLGPLRKPGPSLLSWPARGILYAAPCL
jgi:hypothetical protein